LLDGRKIDKASGRFVGATLKSGPRTLNDSMAREIGNDLVTRASSWAVNHGVKEVDFTYAALYGTLKQSNKKDWHILRNIEELRPPQSKVTVSHKGAWCISYTDGPLKVTATVRVGIDWWEYLGGKNAWIELCCALIRSCIAPTTVSQQAASYTISDLPAIIDTSTLNSNFNVSILQKSQFEWLLFVARHFCDRYAD
jgi:hypothetical protein